MVSYITNLQLRIIKKYSEFFFTDTLWPDFTPDEYENILKDFTHRERRFGGR